MPVAAPLTREQALAVLRRHGIRGAHVYLIDLIPLIEIIWADGKAQESELTIFDAYLEKHVKALNAMAGFQMLSLDEARTFVQRFLRERPDPELVRTLRTLVSSVRLSSSDEKGNEVLRSSLLAACVDIASSSVTVYPYAHGERFDLDEKRSFFEILESMDEDPSDHD
jgi:hypothetical protein